MKNLFPSGNAYHAAFDTARLLKPETRAELAAWVEAYLHLHVPVKALCAGHSSPLDYLAHAFFEGGQKPGKLPADAIVWACRGGGKTQLGAAATLLDLLFKPGVQVRILAGSFEQSEKMYEYLLRLVNRYFCDQLAGQPTQRQLLFTNGSRVQVLAQSDRAVRGQRIQKLRCDEVELFDEAIWNAAQLTTRSVEIGLNGELCDGEEMREAQDDIKQDASLINGQKDKPETGTAQAPQMVRGAIEALSTMHRPAGLMRQLIADAPQKGTPVFAWCVWDVIERCPPQRPCSDCPLWDGCQGRAKTADGFLKIDDLIAMRARVSNHAWKQEMLCLQPKHEDAVFPGFSPARHVAARETPGCAERDVAYIAGVDFGFAGPFVCLWLAITHNGSGDLPHVYVLDELLIERQRLERNAAAIHERIRAGLPHPAVIYCDAAGGQHNSHSGSTDAAVLRAAGFVVKYQYLPIENGIAIIESLLDPAMGPPRLLIHPRCARLIAALRNYRWQPGTGAMARKPIKDGVHDHPLDALRYALCGQLHGGSAVRVRMY